MAIFKKLAIAGAILGSALILSACNNYNLSSEKTPSGGVSSANGQSQTNNNAAQDKITISATDNGFSPTNATVKSGGEITWVNNSSAKIQVGSDPHPTHTSNPEITGGQFVIELAPGASSAVTVTKKGTWGYHDHLNPASRGKVVVE